MGANVHSDCHPSLSWHPAAVENGLLLHAPCRVWTCGGLELATLFRAPHGL